MWNQSPRIEDHHIETDYEFLNEIKFRALIPHESTS